ncbi:MAG: hypothetical protein ACPHUF_12505 [Gammaproteobacteria bacterium]
MNTRNQLVCAWSALGFAVIALAGYLLADFIPPISPDLDAVAVAAIYKENTLSMRLGVLLIMSSACFICSFAAALASVMRHIEGGTGPYTMTQLGGGCVSSLIFVICGVFFTGAAFRPDQAPEMLRMLNDLGWITMLMTFAPFIIQNISLGLCILSDTSDTPVFPRWVGYYNLWVAVLFMPGGLLTFFKTGPFAWDGLFVWWVPFAVFFTWYVFMPFITSAAIKRQAQIEQNATA